MFIGHIAWNKQCHASGTRFHRTAYCFTDLGRYQSVAFRILDLGLVFPVTTDEQTAVNRLPSVNRGHFLTGNLTYP